MPVLKIYPPNRLPDKNVSENQFNMWQEELEVYLSQEKEFKVFLTGNAYDTWESAEENSNRIAELRPEHRAVENLNNEVGEIITQEQAEEFNNDTLDGFRTNLRTVLSIIGKCVSEGHYTSVIRHSTSLSWIYNMLRSDYDIQSKGAHFF